MPEDKVSTPEVMSLTRTTTRVMTATYESDSSRGRSGAVNIEFDPYRINNPTGNPAAGRFVQSFTTGPKGRFEAIPAVFVSIVGFSQFDETVKPVSQSIVGPRPTEEDPSQRVIVNVTRLDRDSMDIEWNVGTSQGRLLRLSVLVAGEVPKDSLIATVSPLPVHR